MKRLIFALSAAALMLAACTANRDKVIDQIEEHELQLSTLDVGSADAEVAELMGLYRQYAADFPDDSLAPVYLMRAADLSINTGQPEQAVGLLDTIIDLYSGYDDVAGCWFLKGFAYESAGRYDEARQAYTYFVDNYPDHYLADDARKTLPYIGMSPEEMFDAIMNSANDNGLSAI